VKSANGRSDAVVKNEDTIFVFEFKLKGTAALALKQIDDQGYMIPYSEDGRKVVKVGVAFDKKKCNIGRWVVG
jgi:hypothetical protein